MRTESHPGQTPQRPGGLEYYSPGPRTPAERAEAQHRVERQRNTARVTIALFVIWGVPLVLIAAFVLLQYFKVL